MPGLLRGDLLATHEHAHIMLAEDLMLALAVSASFSFPPSFVFAAPLHTDVHTPHGTSNLQELPLHSMCVLVLLNAFQMPKLYIPLPVRTERTDDCS